MPRLSMLGSRTETAGSRPHADRASGEALLAMSVERPGRTVPTLLAGIVVLAAVVRFWGLWFGLPLTAARPDETFVIDVARSQSRRRRKMVWHARRFGRVGPPERLEIWPRAVVP